MQFDFATMPEGERYKLMSAAITPRPIAWLTTVSSEGLRNAAPYSFFNMMGAEPPLVAIGLMRRADGSYKDSARNILETGAFVVNLVSEADAATMNFTCIDAPPEFDELDAAQIATLPSSLIAPPRIASVPVAMECRLHQSVEVGRTTVVLGKVLQFHIRDDLIDPERLHVDTIAMNLVARMHGAGWYTRCTDLFQLKRPVYDEWLEVVSADPQS
ncbi:MAG: flavin reductase family protein [Alphaproteobacteria bacterium]|nr:flavin reductase family protein [Alphaproteobacteria bacterium]MBU0795219.1 flavin reductase family protein [Alphaproteobacteria bacterium]MBU0876661.1 flavin reductase family protein [Alphaproteobacteria bacterium]MBU1769363.1 flavin reductase family protein [Alphaproteobacteria bacterium]